MLLLSVGLTLHSSKKRILLHLLALFYLSININKNAKILLYSILGFKNMTKKFYNFFLFFVLLFLINNDHKNQRL